MGREQGDIQLFRAGFLGGLLLFFLQLGQSRIFRHGFEFIGLAVFSAFIAEDIREPVSFFLDGEVLFLFHFFNSLGRKLRVLCTIALPYSVSLKESSVWGILAINPRSSNLFIIEVAQLGECS